MAIGGAGWVGDAERGAVSRQPVGADQASIAQELGILELRVGSQLGPGVAA